MASKRASYRECVEYIALNDSPGDRDDAGTIAAYATVGLMSAMFGKPAHRIAEDVFRYREKHADPEHDFANWDREAHLPPKRVNHG